MRRSILAMRRFGRMSPGSVTMNGMLKLLVPLALLAVPLQARADIAASVTAVFSAETVSARDAALAELNAAKAGDPLAAYAAGSAEFFVALEKLATGLHRHGFESPQSFMLPLMRLPVPENPEPQPLTYEGFRQILLEFREGMAQSVAKLAAVPGDADFGVAVDLRKLGIDLDEDGRIDPLLESAAAIMASFNNSGDAPDASPLVFRFDRADGYWLQGYANFLMAQADFWLAHDFRQAFDESFHMLFPKAKLPMQDALVPLEDGGSSIFSSEWRLADFVSFVHLINWPVAEPERRKAARNELLEMIRLSREDWKAIRAETDNDREWVPGPQQPGANQLTGLEVTEEQVRAWHAALEMAQDLLEGRRLLPHFRFADKGVNMKRFFEDPRTFDLVLSITGPGVVPYMERGPMLTSEEWWGLQSQFGGAGLMTFALWFN
jgi:hypothetical protein